MISSKVPIATSAIDHKHWATHPYTFTREITREIVSGNYQSRQELICKIASVILVTLYQLICFAVVLYTASRGVINVSGENTPKGIRKTTKTLEIFGKQIFLMVAVPIYAICYAIPKKIIESIPRICNYTINKVQRIIRSLIQNILSPFWHKILVPTWTAIQNMTIVIANKFCALLVKVAKVAEKCFKFIFNNLLLPIFNKILTPLYNRVVEFTSYVFSKLFIVIRTIVSKAIEANRYFWNTIVYSCLCKITAAIKKIALITKEAYDALSAVIVKIAKHVFRTILSPVWHKILVPTYTAIKNITIVIGNQVAALIEKTAKATEKCFKFIFNNLLLPIFNKILTPLYNRVVEFSSYICSKLYLAVKTIFRKVLEANHYFWNTIVYSCLCKIGATIKKMAVIAQEAYNALSATIVKIAKHVFRTILSPVWHKILVPTYTAIKNITIVIGNQVAALIEKTAKATEKCFKCIVNNLLLPIFNKILTPLYNRVIAFSSYVCSKLYFAIKTIFKKVADINAYLWNKVLYPCLHKIQTTMKTIALITQEACQALLAKIAKIAQDIFEKVLLPLMLFLEQKYLELTTTVSEFTNNTALLVQETFEYLANIFTKAQRQPA